MGSAIKRIRSTYVSNSCWKAPHRSGAVVGMAEWNLDQTALPSLGMNCTLSLRNVCSFANRERQRARTGRHWKAPDKRRTGAIVYQVVISSNGYSKGK